jgi:hypothetical protein
MKIIVPIILTLFCFTATAQTTILGSIGGMTFEPSGNPWLVTQNVFIENDSKTIVKPGCVFLFKPYTGIVVHGTFIVEGKKENPVIFSSINDTAYNKTSVKKAEPFDWNGILIENEAVEVNLSHFKVSYSVYGIKSKISTPTINNGLFRQNGQFHFTINEKIQEVESNLPFNYNSQSITTRNDKPARGKSGERVWVKPVGISSISVGTVLLGTMGYFIYSAFDNDKKYDNNSEYGDVQHYLVKRDNAVKGAIITGIIGGTLVPTGTGLLIWEHKKKGKKKTVSVYPVTGEANGIKMVLKF